MIKGREYFSVIDTLKHNANEIKYSDAIKFVFALLQAAKSMDLWEQCRALFQSTLWQ